MITIRFAGWISGRIVSLQLDTDIQKLFSNGNRIRIRISETRDAGTGVHYGGTAPLPFERGGNGAQVPLHNRFHM